MAKCMLVVTMLIPQAAPAEQTQNKGTLGLIVRMGGWKHSSINQIDNDLAYLLPFSALRKRAEVDSKFLLKSNASFGTSSLMLTASILHFGQMVGTSSRFPLIQHLVQIAKQLHFKICILLLHGGKPIEAVSWFRQHAASYTLPSCLASVDDDDCLKFIGDNPLHVEIDLVSPLTMVLASAAFLIVTCRLLRKFMYRRVCKSVPDTEQPATLPVKSILIISAKNGS